MEDTDDWLAPDKFHHILFCFSLTILFSLLATRARYAFIRRRSIWIGSILSLFSGAAKEAADELGFFKSSGASGKDAVSDLLGIVIASLALSLSKSCFSRVGPDRSGQLPGPEMV